MKNTPKICRSGCPSSFFSLSFLGQLGLTAIVSLICSDDGFEYAVVLDEEGQSPAFKVLVKSPRVRNGEIGHVYLDVNGEEMEIQDLIIDDAKLLIYTRTGFFWFLREEKREIKSFRGLGLGTALLNAVIEYAKGERIRKIKGDIVEKDFKANSKLPDWYRKHGFTVQMNADGTGNLCMNLE